jgi:hypothetical protein
MVLAWNVALETPDDHNVYLQIYPQPLSLDFLHDNINCNAVFHWLSPRSRSQERLSLVHESVLSFCQLSLKITKTCAQWARMMRSKSPSELLRVWLLKPFSSLSQASLMLAMH